MICSAVKSVSVLNLSKGVVIMRKLIIAIIVLFVLDYLKFDFAYGQYSSFILLMLYIAEGLILTLILILGVCTVFRKNGGKRSVLLLAVSVLLISLFYVLPYTTVYTKADITLHEKTRNEVFTMFEYGKLDSCRINEDIYTLPIKYRLTSHNSRVRFNADKKEILFYIRCGFFKTRAVIYSPNDNFSSKDFRLNAGIDKIKKHWYTAEF